MLDVIRQWLRAAFRRDALNREMSDEMREHLERSTVRLMSRGMSRADATSAARREFGNVGWLQEEGRAARGGTWIDALRADFRYAVRGLRATPVFTTVAILSLAIGIGANTAIFSLINAVMLKSLPVERPSELVQFVLTDGGKTLASSGRSFPNSFWEALRDQRGGIGAFSGFAVSGRTEFDLAEGSVARLVSGVVVNGDYFRTLGVRPALGRLISRADDVRGCQATVVVSHAFWQAELGRRTNVINTTLRMGQQPFTIIGVAPASFFGTNVGIAPKLYVPVCAIGSERLDSRDFWWLNVLGRLNAGVSLAQANASLGAMSRDLLDASMPTRSTNAAATARRLQLVAAGKGMSYVRDEYAPALLALMGMVALVLLISCANVANLLLARGMARGRETAIRMAIGASRARLLRQHLTEGVVLAAGGAVAGIGLAHFGSRILVALLGRGASAYNIAVDLSLDGRVLAFTMAVGVATVMICALVPAWRSTRVDPQLAMKAGGRGMIEGHSRFTIVKTLVVLQCALALILAVGAGLLLGTFTRLTTLDPGFRADGVLIMSVDMHRVKAEPTVYPSLQQRLLSELRAQPGLREASVSALTPIGRVLWSDEVVADGVGVPGQHAPQVLFNSVSDGFFRTMGTRLVEGRDFGVTDIVGGPAVAVVNRTTAQRYFQKASPLGRTIRVLRNGKLGAPIAIVGVVEDTKYLNLREDLQPIVYLASSQDSTTSENAEYEIRVTGSASAAMAQVKAVVERVDARYSLKFTSLSNQLAQSLLQERMLAALSGFFGALALLLAMLGLYGVMTYMVARRRVEIGIRVALGAARSRIVGLVLRDVFRMTLFGIVLGGVGAFALSRLLTAFLYDLSPGDPRTLLAAMALLAFAALTAGAIPAHRAATMQPTDALRED